MNPDWAQASVTDEDDHVDRPLAIESWGAVQNARVVDGVLTWESAFTEVQPDAELLARFLKLATADDAAIAAFANRYGVLSLCEHDLPASHNPPSPSYGLEQRDWCRAGFKNGKWVYEEPVAIWRQLAVQAHALLNITAAVRSGRPGSAWDWRMASERSARQAPWWQQSAAADSRMLADYVNSWLQLGNVRPLLAGQELRMSSSGGLFGALALRLASAVAGSRSVFLCDYCGNQIDLSKRNRRPQAGRKAFCDDCRAKGVPAKVRAEEARTRKQGAL